MGVLVTRGAVLTGAALALALARCATEPRRLQNNAGQGVTTRANHALRAYL